jgi:hypothetical protein
MRPSIVVGTVGGSQVMKASVSEASSTSGREGLVGAPKIGGFDLTL